MVSHRHGTKVTVPASTKRRCAAKAEEQTKTGKLPGQEVPLKPEESLG
jgi:hypothetical protein